MLKTFTTDLRRNLLKIFCLSTGLAVGMMVVAKIYFEETFDRFLPDAEKIFIVNEAFEMNGEYNEIGKTSGAIAPGMRRYLPQVSMAVRKLNLSGSLRIQTPDGRIFDTEGIALADSTFFDFFGQGIVAGDAVEVLSVANKCMIPESLARKIGGDVIGMWLKSPDINGEYAMEVGGVYKDFPLNSSNGNQIFLSMSSIGMFTYDGRENWIGNDRYQSFVKLIDGTNPEDLQEGIKRMLEENVDKSDLESTHYNIYVKPLIGEHAKDADNRTMLWILTVLALIVLGSASLNYLLIVLGQTQWRWREIAVRKVFGTSQGSIFRMIFTESAAYMGISLAVAAVIALSFSSRYEQLLGASAWQLMSTEKVWIVGLILCLGLLAITGLAPALIYSRLPVTGTFRRNRLRHRNWKLTLLAVQFFAAGFIFCLLSVVGRQYYMITNSDYGFEFENVARASLFRVPEEERGKLVQELGRISGVEGVATADSDFFYNGSGNQMWTDNYAERIFIVDLYYANPEIFDVLGIKLIQGELFDAPTDTVSNRIVVEEGVVPLMKERFGIDSGDVTGQTVHITEHEYSASGFEIYGVIKEMRRGGFSAAGTDPRPAIMFPASNYRNNLYIRFSRLDSRSLTEAQRVIDKLCPDAEIVLMPYGETLRAVNKPVRDYASSILIAGAVIIIITLIGLTGYATEEVNSRAKEIAIRKVNGMNLSGILALFCRNVLVVALPALILGAAAAMIAGHRWLSDFTERVSLSPAVLLLVVAAILAVLAITVIAACYRVASANPVKYLRDE